MLRDEQVESYGVGFFERLGREPGRLGQAFDIDDVVQSIKRNISHVLNTRMGESLSCPELGLFDFNDASSGTADLCLKMRRGIIQCLRVFEPRLSNLEVEVLFDEDRPMSLRFQVFGQISVTSRNDKLKIDLLLDNNRSYTVL